MHLASLSEIIIVCGIDPERENKKALLTEFPGSRTPGWWPCLGCGQGLLREVGVGSTGEAGPDARLEGGALLPSAEPQACEF